MKEVHLNLQALFNHEQQIGVMPLMLDPPNIPPRIASRMPSAWPLSFSRLIWSRNQLRGMSRQSSSRLACSASPPAGRPAGQPPPPPFPASRLGCLSGMVWGRGDTGSWQQGSNRRPPAAGGCLQRWVPPWMCTAPSEPVLTFIGTPARCLRCTHARTHHDGPACLSQQRPAWTTAS